jgi:hypothetical protein
MGESKDDSTQYHAGCGGRLYELKEDNSVIGSKCSSCHKEFGVKPPPLQPTSKKEVERQRAAAIKQGKRLSRKKRKNKRTQ